MEYQEKFVDFDEYCEACKNLECNVNEEPCDSCLAEPVNEYSHKPINFEEAREDLLKKIREVRHKSGVGMVQARIALEKNKYDVEKAISWIREIALSVKEGE